MKNMGSVSHGTHREEDLIPEFIWTLEHQKPCMRKHRKMIAGIKSRMEEEGYYDGNDAAEDVQELFDALDAYALPYFYFGAHPGDGSDFGFWLSENFEEDFDGPKVSASSELPKGFAGEYLVVNNHGNVTLYVKGRNGHVREIWGVV